MAECEICSEQPLYQKILKCGQTVKHYFCEVCLEVLKKKDESSHGYNVTCPKCRIVTSIPEGKLENLQTKLYVQLSCDECSEEKVIDEQWWCETCSQLICGNCAMIKHRDPTKHNCSLFCEDVIKNIVTSLLNISAEQAEIEKRIDELFDDMKIEMKKAMLYQFDVNNLAMKMLSTNSDVYRDSNKNNRDEQRIRIEGNCKKKMKIFCELSNKIAGSQQFDFDKTMELLQCRKTASFSVIYEYICERFKSKISSSPSTQHLKMVRKISIGNKESPIQVMLIPAIGFCVIELNCIKMLKLLNGESFSHKYWHTYDIKHPISNICAKYISFINCIIVTCITKGTCIGLILDVPTFNLQLKINLANLFISIHSPVHIECSSDGYVILANSDGKKTYLSCYLFERNNSIIYSVAQYFTDLSANFEPFKNIVIGSKSGSGQTLYVLGTSVVYKFLFTKDEILLNQRINVQISPLSCKLLLNWKESVFIFFNHSRELVNFENEEVVFKADQKLPKELFAKSIFGDDNSIFILNFADVYLYQYSLPVESKQ